MPSRRSRTSEANETRDSGAPESQRVDKWIWYARVVKTRGLAAELVTTGKVRVNSEKIARTSTTLKVGDVVTLSVRGRIRVLKVLSPGTRRGPAAEAQGLYEDLSPPTRPAGAAPSDTDADNAVHDQAAPARDPGSGRPTKRDRRLIDRLRG